MVLLKKSMILSIKSVGYDVLPPKLGLLISGNSLEGDTYIKRVYGTGAL